jgi:hypothetical protein
MKASAFVMPFLLASVIFSNVAAAKMNHAALAVLPKHGKQFHGLGYGATAAEAQKAALAKCSNGRCEVVQLYRPGQCLNLVIGAYQIFWNTKASEDLTTVMRYCKKRDPDCRKLVSACLPR